VGVVGAAGAAADLPSILNMTVPHVGHLPLMALRPFFIVSSTPLEISFLALHLTQYPSAINLLPLAHHAFYGGGRVTPSLANVNSKGKTSDFKGLPRAAAPAGGSAFEPGQTAAAEPVATDCNRASR
jgi:hypothetical protein